MKASGDLSPLPNRYFLVVQDLLGIRLGLGDIDIIATNIKRADLNRALNILGKPRELLLEAYKLPRDVTEEGSHENEEH